MATTEYWELSSRCPETYAEWKAEVAAGATLTGFVLWVALNRPAELAKAKQ